MRFGKELAIPGRFREKRMNQDPVRFEREEARKTAAWFIKKKNRVKKREINFINKTGKELSRKSYHITNGNLQKLK
ncbi:MAG: hypothetical protein LUF35_03390 [Lachnospiraceae bacterium]|nr:hypothetical protein [Lachnospiraceae bacterium]